MAMTQPVIERLTNGVVMRRMTEHDLLEVVEIEEQSGLSRWGWAAYYAELQGANRDLMVVAEAGQPRLKRISQAIAGYIVARIGANELHINNVAVRQQFRRQGIGLNLLTHILKEGKMLGVNAAFLELRAGNRVARSLYEKCGFEVTARRKNYYSDPPEDALVMTLQMRNA
ncbi:MAG TPA: ribosomal protein S18-alanine N-acetyltransferase [Pyrinomonadaceae bacterium]|nr:ribosomal protein S18-alanine N-acetyltransferase [Pyrinomonadaceae bacterium]